MATNNHLNVRKDMDEIVFEGRNHDYGAFFLRKKYNKYITIAFLIAFVIVASAVLTPLIASYYNRDKNNKKLQKEVTIEMEKLKEEAPPPPPPPPPPPEAVTQVVKFKAPVVVDSTVKEVAIASNDELNDVANEAPPTEIVVEEKKVVEVVEEEKPFIVVEENATFQGGDITLFRNWVQEHVVYPENAKEMAIEGTVIVQFVINQKGKVEAVKVVRGVDPSLDQVTISTIQGSPNWVPAKQGGKAVKQIFTLPIKFQLQK